MRSNRLGWLYLAPTLLILALMGLVPFFYVLYVSFFDWNPFAASREMSFAAAKNFRELVFDQGFLDALRRTATFAVYAIVGEVTIGFILAQLLARDFPGKTIFRTIHALPLMVAPIAVGAAWRLLVMPGFGPMPIWLDQWFGFDYNIGNSTSAAMFTLVLMDIWHWTPFVTLTLLAGLTSMPVEPFEAAKVDGASTWQSFRYLTLPMIRPVLLTTLFIRIMDALRIVDEAWMLTNGGPSDSTQFIGIYIWRIVFPKTDYGYGSAMSIIALYLTIVLCWLLFVAITRSDIAEQAQS